MSERCLAPRLMYVTDSTRSPRDIVDVARAAARGGVDAVQIREPLLSDRAIVDLTRRIRAAVAPQALVLVNERFDLALAAGADGVHLRAGGLDPASVRDAARTAIASAFLVGLATHDADQLAAASRASVVDYCTIGPMRDSPGKMPLGTEALGRLLDDVRRFVEPCPYLVLGGVVPSDASTVAGLSRPGERWGLAAIRAFQDAGDDEAIRRVAARMREGLSAMAP